jgi:hypothetical protein
VAFSGRQHVFSWPWELVPQTVDAPQQSQSSRQLVKNMPGSRQQRLSGGQPADSSLQTLLRRQQALSLAHASCRRLQLPRATHFCSLSLQMRSPQHWQSWEQAGPSSGLQQMVSSLHAAVSLVPQTVVTWQSQLPVVSLQATPRAPTQTPPWSVPQPLTWQKWPEAQSQSVAQSSPGGTVQTVPPQSPGRQVSPEQQVPAAQVSCTSRHGGGVVVVVVVLVVVVVVVLVVVLVEVLVVVVGGGGGVGCGGGGGVSGHAPTVAPGNFFL